MFWVVGSKSRCNGNIVRNTDRVGMFWVFLVIFVYTSQSWLYWRDLLNVNDPIAFIETIEKGIVHIDQINSGHVDKFDR